MFLVRKLLAAIQDANGGACGPINLSSNYSVDPATGWTYWRTHDLTGKFPAEYPLDTFNRATFFSVTFDSTLTYAYIPFGWRNGGSWSSPWAYGVTQWALDPNDPRDLSLATWVGHCEFFTDDTNLTGRIDWLTSPVWLDPNGKRLYFFTECYDNFYGENDSPLRSIELAECWDVSSAYDVLTHPLSNLDGWNYWYCSGAFSSDGLRIWVNGDYLMQYDLTVPFDPSTATCTAWLDTMWDTYEDWDLIDKLDGDRNLNADPNTYFHYLTAGTNQTPDPISGTETGSAWYDNESFMRHFYAWEWNWTFAWKLTSETMWMPNDSQFNFCYGGETESLRNHPYSPNEKFDLNKPWVIQYDPTIIQAEWSQNDLSTIPNDPLRTYVDYGDYWAGLWNEWGDPPTLTDDGYAYMNSGCGIVSEYRRVPEIEYETVSVQTYFQAEYFVNGNTFFGSDWHPDYRYDEPTLMQWIRNEMGDFVLNQQYAYISTGRIIEGHVMSADGKTFWEMHEYYLKSVPHVATSNTVPGPNGYHSHSSHVLVEFDLSDDPYNTALLNSVSSRLARIRTVVPIAAWHHWYEETQYRDDTLTVTYDGDRRTVTTHRPTDPNGAIIIQDVRLGWATNAGVYENNDDNYYNLYRKHLNEYPDWLRLQITPDGNKMVMLDDWSGAFYEWDLPQPNSFVGWEGSSKVDKIRPFSCSGKHNPSADPDIPSSQWRPIWQDSPLFNGLCVVNNRSVTLDFRAHQSYNYVTGLVQYGGAMDSIFGGGSANQLTIWRNTYSRSPNSWYPNNIHWTRDGSKAFIDWDPDVGVESSTRHFLQVQNEPNFTGGPSFFVEYDCPTPFSLQGVNLNPHDAGPSRWHTWSADDGYSHSYYNWSSGIPRYPVSGCFENDGSIAYFSWFYGGSSGCAAVFFNTPFALADYNYTTTFLSHDWEQWEMRNSQTMPVAGSPDIVLGFDRGYRGARVSRRKLSMT